jgi:minor extracellular serine protease Vpr
MKKPWLNLLLVVAMVLVTATPAFAQEPDAVPDSVPAHAQTDDAAPASLPDGYTGFPDGFIPSTQLYVPLATTSLASAHVVIDSATMQSASASGGMVSAADLALPSPVEVIDTMPARLNSELGGLTGRVQVVVRLSRAAVTEAVAVAGEEAVVAAEVQAEVQRAALSQQEQVIAWVKGNDASATVLARLQIVLNALVFEVDGTLLPSLAQVPGVVSINPVVHYERDLATSVPAIGGTAAHSMGYTGEGVVVAVLDSGADYTHAALGGAGTQEAYDAAYADPASRDGLFPTAKVIDGYDFVGEDWPTYGPAVSDPDPIDAVGEAPLAGGHGTHVSDIIAGVLGVAPDAKLMAVKVCSAVSTSCNGVAMLQGAEFAMDPNGDGNISDAADIINLSLGSQYGQKQDDMVLALENAVKAGTVVVASAGNSANKPYIVGSPSIGPSLISVAQTTMPGDAMQTISSAGLASPLPILWQTFTPEQVGAVTAPIATLAGEPTATQRIACAPLANSYAGSILIVDRGTCSISTKFFHAAAAGAVIAIVVDNVAGTAPPSFSSAGEPQSIPGYSMRRADGTTLKALAGQQATIDPSQSIALYMSMAGTSSRGPSYSFQSIKPDLGAPGASISAESGTGTGTTPFGGTSGAAPMVSGAAALVLDAKPNLRPYEVRALLMNNADTNVYVNQAILPGYLAPITRIGAGQIRVDQAIDAKVVAYEKSSRQGSLSFGYHAMTRDLRFKTTVEVKNYSNQTRTYKIHRATRYANDAWGIGGSNAVFVHAPSEVRVPAHGRATFDVTLFVFAGNLPTWTLSGGAQGGNGDMLDTHEFDGYITLSQKNGSDVLSIPWHILPKKAAQLNARIQVNRTEGWINLSNRGGATDGYAEVFALTGVSPRIPANQLPGLGDNFAIVDLQGFGYRAVDIGGGDYGIQFGISTYGQRSHPSVPAEFDIYVDTNNDGVDDYVIYTAEINGIGATGTVAVYVVDLATSTGGAYFYVDAAMNSGNVIMTAPLFALGADLDTQMRVSVYAFDNYFTGNLTDAIENMVLTPGLPAYGPLPSLPAVAPNATYNFAPWIFDGGEAATPSQFGFLMLYRNQGSGYEADIITAESKWHYTP